jgi:peptidoglycan/LPS O-acetylase OafA/YrhL
MVLGRHAGMAIALLHASNDYSICLTRVGWAGVDLFFVLSGFLISGLLFADYQERGRIGVSRFYVRRGFKIWPAFYTLIAAGLLIDAVMPGHRFSAKGLLPELVFMQDYFHGIWGITWSLAVEEHFYLTLPLVLLLMLRREKAKPFDVMPYLFAAIAVFSLACRFAAGWRENGAIAAADTWVWLFPTHLRMDGLMFGVLLCYYSRFRPDVFKRIVSGPGGWMMAAAAAALLSTVPVENRNMHTWGFTAIYLGAGCLVAKAVAAEGPRPVRVVSRLLARIGVYSYSIYLWHMFFAWRVLPHFHVTSPAGLFWWYLLGPIPFGMAAAKVIEIPALRFRDRMFPPVSKGPAVSRTALSTEGAGEAPSGGVPAG